MLPIFISLKKPSNFALFLFGGTEIPLVGLNARSGAGNGKIWGVCDFATL